MTEAAETTDIATLPPADRALIVLASVKTEEHLQSLVTEATAITDVIDTDGREQAHRLGMKLRNARTTIEKTGKAARDDANAFTKAVLDEQKRLIAITEAEEKRVIALRDAFDFKIEAEKEAKRQAEAKRISEIKGKIEGIRALPLALAGASADEIEAEWQAMTDFEPNEVAFAEFTAECAQARHEVLGALSDLHARVKGQEAAAAMVEAQRKALEEANRAAAESLAAERKELEEARAALAKERAEIEAMRAAVAPSVDPVGTETEPVAEEQTEVMPEVEVSPEVAAQVFSKKPTPFHIRRAAMATADQFHALAGKCYACGASAFGTELQAAADALREGQFDDALAGADSELLVSFDSALLDATVACIEALSEEEQAAA